MELIPCLIEAGAQLAFSSPMDTWPRGEASYLAWSSNGRAAPSRDCVVVAGEYHRFELPIANVVFNSLGYSASIAHDAGAVPAVFPMTRQPASRLGRSRFRPLKAELCGRLGRQS